MKWLYIILFFYAFLSFAEDLNDTVLLPLILNQRVQQSVQAQVHHIGDKEIILVPAKTIISMLKEIGRKPPKDLLKREEGTISLDDLREIGFYVYYDEAKVEVLLQSLSDSSHPDKLSLMGDPNHILEGQELKPENFSGYLNTSFTSGFRRDYLGTVYGDPAMARLDGVLNVHSYVIEASGQIQDSAPFQREDVRLTKEVDLFDGTRISVGDLFYPVRGYQGYRKLGGVSFYTIRDQARGYLSAQASNHLVEVKRPSTLTFYVNENVVATRKVMPGLYDVSDIPLASGLNQVRVVVDAEGTGEREQLIFNEFFSDYGIKKGQQDFAVAIGEKTVDEEGARHYKSENKTLMVNHRYDLTNSYSLSEYVQLDQQYRLFGTINAFHILGGYIETDVAGSSIDNDKGIAARAAYYKTAKNKFSILSGDRYTLSFDRKFKGFRMIDQTSADGFLTFSSAYTLPPIKTVTLSLGLSFQESDLGEKMTSYSVQLDKPFGDFFISLGAQEQLSSRRPDDLSLNLTLNYSPSERSYYLNSQRTQSGHIQNQLAINTTKDQNVRGTVTASEDPGVRTMNAQVTGQTNRAEFTFSGNRVDTDYDRRYSERFSLNTRFALAFAGNKTAIGRPVSDSFILSDTANPNRRYKIESWGRYSETGPMGEAMLGFQNYQANQVRAYSTEAYSKNYLNAEDFSSNHAYKNGFVIRVKDKISPTIVTVRADDLESYKLAVIKFKNMNTGEEYENVVSSEGEIYLEDLEAGRYQYMILEKTGFIQLEASGGSKELTLR